MRKTRGACTIAVFARAPVNGQCKTRLIPRLGAVGAANLQREFISRTVETALKADCGRVELWCSPDISHDFFTRCAAHFAIPLKAQQGTDLGARMHNAFASSLPPLILIGTDSPCITVDDIRASAMALEDGADAVFLPAEDGGYGLVGLANACTEIFQDMQWSTADVMSETRRRLTRLDYKWRELRTIWDVDLPADYDRLLESGLMASHLLANNLLANNLLANNLLASDFLEKTGQPKS